MGKAFFVAGTDTDAGKTTVVCGLLRAFAILGREASAIKPVQTGCPPGGAAPDAERWRRCGAEGRALRTYRVPCSPDLAARMEGRTIDVQVLAREVFGAVASARGMVLLEGAGGLYVPLNDSEHMLDLMGALRLPVVLVVGNRLGCINHALLSLDALEKCGLSTAGMILCRTTPPDSHDAGTDDASERAILSGNAAFLRREGERRGVPLLADIPWDARLSEEGGFPDDLAAGLLPVARHLLDLEDRMPSREISALLDFDRKHLWHPYTSAMKPLAAHAVAGAHGCILRLADGRELVDGMSSWWCRVHGYGNRRLVEAMQRQCARLSHVMFGGLTHEPAVRLGERLLALLPKGLEHLFYADSGSVAVEVAMKMAVQHALATGRGERTRFIALRGAYHGDTIGAMSLCDPVTGMHSLFTGLVPRQIFVERPSCRFPGTSLMHDGQDAGREERGAEGGARAFDDASLDGMRRALDAHAHETAAVVVEPVVQGAGGMWFYHPEYLRRLRRLCDEHGVLLIADEIATGFGRTGRMFACDWAGITPDILCCGKALTGGMMTFSAVAATRAVAAGISNADAAHGGGVFMHGPTFMGNPLACAAACASLDELQASHGLERAGRLQEVLRAGLAPCCGRPGVADVRVLGAIGVVEMERPVDVEAWQEFIIGRGAWIRPFGTTVYVMPPLAASDGEVMILTSALGDAVRHFGGSL